MDGEAGSVGREVGRMDGEAGRGLGEVGRRDGKAVRGASGVGRGAIEDGLGIFKGSKSNLKVPAGITVLGEDGEGDGGSVGRLVVEEGFDGLGEANVAGLGEANVAGLNVVPVPDTVVRTGSAILIKVVASMAPEGAASSRRLSAPCPGIFWLSSVLKVPVC
jgi:hypothetical protein